MTINEFTKDEIEYLRSLRAVSKVTNGRIRYTEEFKRDCMRRYSEGEAPIKIFRDAGLDPVLIGYKRIERCISRWKETEATDDSSRGGGTSLHDGGVAEHESGYAFTPKLRMSVGRRDMRDLLIAQQVRRIDELEHEVDRLRREYAGRVGCDSINGGAVYGGETGAEAVVV